MNFKLSKTKLSEPQPDTKIQEILSNIYTALRSYPEAHAAVEQALSPQKE